MISFYGALVRRFLLSPCRAIAIYTPIFLAAFASLYLSSAQAASCSVSREYHYKAAKPGVLLNPYHKRMRANSYVPLAYAVNQSGGRTLEARLSAQNSLAGCRKSMAKCFKAKISSSLKDYRYCVKTNAKGRIARTVRIK